MKEVLIVDLQNSKNTYLNFKFIVDESMTLAQNSIEMIINVTGGPRVNTNHSFTLGHPVAVRGK